MESNTISDFYEKVAKLHGTVTECDDKVDRLIAHFEGQMEMLGRGIKSALEKLTEKYGKSELVDFVEQLSGHIGNSLDSWEKKQTNDAKGHSLRNKAGDSLLIIIYGKVKAGKSSLGNLVARNSPGKAKASFFIFDRAGNKSGTAKLEELEGGAFETRTTECTTSIQGFEIPGLTWIDTPGLASMTDANGVLAKEYVAAADLIIYPMSSDSPGRHTDTDEIKALAKAGKEFCVLITKSDVRDEDEKDGELVSVWLNKPDADRQEQENWVRTEILKKLKEVFSTSSSGAEKQMLGEILSISVKTAQEYSEGSEEWRGSNIRRLYEMLNRIVDKEAVRLRAEQPLKNVSAFFRECISGTDSDDSLSHRIDTLETQIRRLTKKAKELTDSRDELVTQSISEVSIEVQQEVMNAKKQGLSGKDLSARIAGAVHDTVKKNVEPRAREILADITQELASEFPVSEVIGDGLDIRSKTKTIKVTNETVSKGTGGAIVATLGGIAGAFFGGPAGAIVGSLIGGAIGAKVGESFTTSTEKEITVGDNLQEVEDMALKMADNAVKSSIDAALTMFNGDIVTPIVSLLEGIKGDIEETVKVIKQEIKI